MMNRLALVLMAAASLSSSQVLAQEADEQPEVPQMRLSVGVSLGYGADMGNDEPVTPFGLAIRPHLGLTLAEGIYLGALANIGLGASDDAPVIDRATGMQVGTAKHTASSLFVGGEFGYDVPLGQTVTMRPTIGFGAAIMSGEVCVMGGECVSDSRMYPSMQFGARFVLPLGIAYLGLDLAYLMVPNKEAVNPADEAFIGLEFGVAPSFDAP